MSQDSEMSTNANDDDPNLLMFMTPDDPSTSAHSNANMLEQRMDRIVGRQVQKGKLYYEVQAAACFGFSSSIIEEPSRIAPYNLAKYEYELHNRRESAFPIPGTDPNSPPVSIRWFGKMDEQRYFLIEYENQVQRLIEMNDTSNSLDPATRQFVCDNLEFYLKSSKIDINGDQWPSDPINFDSFPDEPGPSTRNATKSSCSCPISRFFQRAKPKLCLNKLESLIRRKKPPTCSSRKKGLQTTNSDSSDEEPPKKCGRHM